MEEIQEACEGVFKEHKDTLLAAPPTGFVKLDDKTARIFKPNVIPLHPGKGGNQAEMLLLDGDCANPDGVSDAVDELEGFLKGGAKTCMIINAPGTGKSKALCDLLRRNFGILLDLAPEGQDVNWNATWKDIRATACEDNFKWRVAEEGGEIKPAIMSLRRSVMNQLGANILSRLLALTWLSENLSVRALDQPGKLTPDYWLRFQMIHRRQEGIFRDLCRCIYKKNLNAATVQGALEIATKSLCKNQHAAAASLNLEQFVIVADEFHFLQNIRKYFMHEGEFILLDRTMCACMCGFFPSYFFF